MFSHPTVSEPAWRSKPPVSEWRFVEKFLSEIAGSIILLRLVVARRRTFDLVPGLPKTQQSLAYAERAHAGQRRETDGSPFILHPREVAALLYTAGAATT